jgi:hypothetical protein
MLVELDGEAWYDLRWSSKYVSEITEMVAHIRGHIQQTIVQA